MSSEMKRYTIGNGGNTSFLTARDHSDLMDKFSETLRKFPEDKINKTKMRYVKSLRKVMRIIKADFYKNKVKGYWILDESKLQICDWTNYIECIVKINSFLCLKKGDWTHFSEIQEVFKSNPAIEEASIVAVIGQLVEMGEVEFGYYNLKDPNSYSGDKILGVTTTLSDLKPLPLQEIGCCFRSKLYLQTFAPS